MFQELVMYFSWHRPTEKKASSRWGIIEMETRPRHLGIWDQNHEQDFTSKKNNVEKQWLISFLIETAMSLFSKSSFNCFHQHFAALIFKKYFSFWKWTINFLGTSGQSVTLGVTKSIKWKQLDPFLLLHCSLSIHWSDQESPLRRVGDQTQ